jgi:hypothetical protein
MRLIPVPTRNQRASGGVFPRVVGGFGRPVVEAAPDGRIGAQRRRGGRRSLRPAGERRVEARRPRTENGGRHCCQPPLRRVSRSSASRCLAASGGSPVLPGVARRLGHGGSVRLAPAFPRFVWHRPLALPIPASPRVGVSGASSVPFALAGVRAAVPLRGGWLGRLRRFRLRRHPRPHPKALMKRRVVRARNRVAGLWIARITGISADQWHLPNGAGQRVGAGPN